MGTLCWANASNVWEKRLFLLPALLVLVWLWSEHFRQCQPLPVHVFLQKARGRSAEVPTKKNRAQRDSATLKWRKAYEEKCAALGVAAQCHIVSFQRYCHQRYFPNYVALNVVFAYPTCSSIVHDVEFLRLMWRATAKSLLP